MNRLAIDIDLRHRRSNKKVSDFLRELDRNIVNIGGRGLHGKRIRGKDAVVVKPDYGGKSKKGQPWQVNKKPKAST
jgi:hypothetical protein